MGTYDEDIDDIVRTVWDTLFALPLERVEPASCAAEPGISGIVVVDGDFQGAVEVVCGGQLARRIAAAMFADEASLSPADIGDALGEVSNMIAGNLKSILPGRNSIGLPIVASGSDYEVVIPRANQVSMVSYVSDGDCLHVSLMRQAERS